MSIDSDRQVYQVYIPQSGRHDLCATEGIDTVRYAITGTNLPLSVMHDPENVVRRREEITILERSNEPELVNDGVWYEVGFNNSTFPIGASALLSVDTTPVLGITLVAENHIDFTAPEISGMYHNILLSKDPDMESDTVPLGQPIPPIPHTRRLVPNIYAFSHSGAQDINITCVMLAGRLFIRINWWPYAGYDDITFSAAE